jgi:phosphoglycolate phosphatase-like HAD superfamily hydrolase
MNKKAIIFDWDGTLLNSMPYKRSNFILLMERFGINQEQALSYHLECSGIPRKELFTQALKKIVNKEISDKEYDLLSDEYTQLNIREAKHASIFSDALAVIPELHKRKYQLFISSSSAPNELKTVVASLKFDHYFSEVMGSEHLSNKGPEHMKHICRKYQLEKNETLFIGDDEKDSYLASMVPMDCFRVDREKKLAIDTRLDNMYDLLKILQ